MPWWDCLHVSCRPCRGRDRLGTVSRLLCPIGHSWESFSQEGTLDLQWESRHRFAVDSSWRCLQACAALLGDS